MKINIKFFLSYFFAFWIILSYNRIINFIILHNYHPVNLQSLISLIILTAIFTFLYYSFLDLTKFNLMLFTTSIITYYMLCGIHNLQELHFYLHSFETRQIDTLQHIDMI